MPLDPQAQKLLDAEKAAGSLPLHFLPVAVSRAKRDAVYSTSEGFEPVTQVQDIFIPSPAANIMIRVFTPAGVGPFPVVVYFHGGGWVLSNINTHDSLCRRLTNQSGCLVVAVEYRLAPENKFPAAIEDAYAATQWVSNNAALFNGDPAKIAVAGDSAGGHLATVVAQLSRDREGPNLSYQVLIYPVTDYFLPGTDSYKEFADGYCLDRDSMIWYWFNFLPNDIEINNPYICPLRTPDLSGLPPAFIITAEYDPLRDEGELYAKRLEESGVPTKLMRYDGMMHLFVLQWRWLDKGREAIDSIGAELLKAFKSKQI